MPPGESRRIVSVSLNGVYILILIYDTSINKLHVGIINIIIRELPVWLYVPSNRMAIYPVYCNYIGKERFMCT